MRRAFLFGLVLACCVAWTGSAPEDADDASAIGDDTSQDVAACEKECRETDHTSCKAICTAPRWPSCGLAAPPGASSGACNCTVGEPVSSCRNACAPSSRSCSFAPP